MRQLIIVVLLSFGVAVFLLDRSIISAAASGAPDKAYLQKIWTGWSTLDVQNVRSYYASGPPVFFDIAPLKYTS